MANNRKVLDYLPVKFEYLYRSKAIRMYYRKAGSSQLFSKQIPYNHYIFVEASDEDVREGKFPVYRHLKTGKYYKQEYMDPRKAKSLTQQFEGSTAEGDVNPVTRFVVDHFIDVEWPNTISPRIFYYDIETEIVGQELPSFQNHEAEITAFTIYDNYTDTYYHAALRPQGCEMSEEELELKIRESLEEYGIKYQVTVFLRPEELIEYLVSLFERFEPDIITSWNSPFDIPVTVRKVYDHLGDDGLKRMSSLGIVYWNVRKSLEEGTDPGSDNLIPGTTTIDLLMLYKKETASEKVSYSLNSVATAELGETKLEYESDLGTLYTEDPVKFSKYNVQDVRLLTLLNAKLKILELAISVRNLAKCDFNGIFFESYSIDNLCLMKAHRWRLAGKNWVLPSAPLVKEKKEYIGAYVKPTIKGRYRWVGDLDYKSEYPSEYVTWGLSPEVIVGEIEDFQAVINKSYSLVFPELSEEEIFEKLMPDFSGFGKYFVPKGGHDFKVSVKPRPIYEGIRREFDSFDEFRDWCIENKFEIMANGLIVDSKTDDPFLGSMAGEIMDLRDEHKVLMKKYDAEGDAENALVYDISNKAIKTINNSLYGVTANAAFRLYDLKLAEAITSTGQCIIKSSTYVVNKFMDKLIRRKKPDHEFRDVVITNDTDSIIFTVEDLVKVPVTCNDVKMFEKIVGVINLSRDEVNREIKHICRDAFLVPDVDGPTFRMYIKNELVASSGLFLAKKGYALNIVFKEGYAKSQFKVVGLSLKKSNTPKAMQEFLAGVVKSILRFDSKESIDDSIMAEAIKLKSYPYEDIACPMGVSGIDTYDSLPIHVRGAKIFNEYFAKSRRDWITNDKVKYLYVGKWLTVPKLNLLKEYVISVPTNRREYWDMLPSIIVPDYPKLRKKLIYAPIEKIYKAMNWEMPNIDRADVRSSFSVFKRKRKVQNEDQ